MITVGIFINDKCVISKSAHRVEEPNGEGEAKYKLGDENLYLYHNPDEGVIPLTKKIVNTISNEDVESFEKERLRKILEDVIK